MSYLSEAEFIELFGTHETITLSNPYSAGATEVNSERLESAINYASNLIDSYISARVNLPLVSIPPVLKNFTGDIARYQLNIIKMRDDVKSRYEFAISWLQEYAMGNHNLGLGEDGLEVEESRVKGRYSSKIPIFTQDSLSGRFFGG